MKLAIIGSGNIVEEALFSMVPIPNIELKAIYARPHSKARGEELAEKYDIDEVYVDYEELIMNADIDTVYIGLVNSAHYDYAKMAILSGKNVILEKPFTGTYQQAEELACLACDNGHFLFEAITVLHNDVFDTMKEMLPQLGNIKMVQCNFSQYSSKYDNYLNHEVSPAFDPDSQGGCLRDLNVYNLFYVIGLFGGPKDFMYFPNYGWNGIDTSGTLVMRYEGFTATCTAAKDSDSDCFVIIQGEKGTMKINGKPNLAPNLTIEYVSGSSGKKDAAGAVVREKVVNEFVPDKPHHRMTREFMDFARMIDAKKHDEMESLLDYSLEVMKIIEI